MPGNARCTPRHAWLALARLQGFPDSFVAGLVRLAHEGKRLLLTVQIFVVEKRDRDAVERFVTRLRDHGIPHLTM